LWRVFGHGEIRWFSSFHETFGFIIIEADLGSLKGSLFKFSSSDSINNHWRVFGHGEIRWFSSFGHAPSRPRTVDKLLTVRSGAHGPARGSIYWTVESVLFRIPLECHANHAVTARRRRDSDAGQFKWPGLSFELDLLN